MVARAPTIETACSTRASSVESSDLQQQQQTPRPPVARRACMDLIDAMALLDETCPNPPEPSPPPSPITPRSRNKRARSKSSDGSSNYSCERLDSREREAQPAPRSRRPFLKKIGISMTEDRPLLAILAPRLMKGRPHLERSGAIHGDSNRPFLDKIGTSRTLDRFTFDAPSRGQQQSPASIAEEESAAGAKRRAEIRGFSTGERRKSGKSFLAKMYSFETEDLEEGGSLGSGKARARSRTAPSRGASLDDTLEAPSGPGSLARISETSPADRAPTRPSSASTVELVRCRVTTSEEIISASSSPMQPPASQAPAENATGAEHPQLGGATVPNSPTKRMHSVTPERVTARYRQLEQLRNSSRQMSEDTLDRREPRVHLEPSRGASADNLAARPPRPVFAEIGSVGGATGTGSNASVASSSCSGTAPGAAGVVHGESYAEFKRSRTQQSNANALKRLVLRERNASPAPAPVAAPAPVEMALATSSPKLRSRSEENAERRAAAGLNRTATRNRSVLRKQRNVDQPNYEPLKREPSRETLELLSGLAKLKGSLGDDPGAVPGANESRGSQPVPRRILLTDNEFCLSLEREGSVRATTKSPRASRRGAGTRLSLDLLAEDGADDAGSNSRPEPRALSLASARINETRGGGTAPLGSLDSSCFEMSRSFGSEDVFSSPTAEEEEALRTPRPRATVGLLTSSSNGTEQSQPQLSPKRKSASDSAEMSGGSPKATGFRMKMRLGRISVEQTEPKHSESFSVASKPECKEMATSATQKKPKCLPL